MIVIISLLLILASVLSIVPSWVLLVEVIASIFPPSDNSSSLVSGRSPRTAILVPAHNESAGLLSTLADLRVHIDSQAQVLVVADNCTDDTAEKARAFGVTVIERTDPSHRGKGYALDFGLRYLASSPPDVVIILDADCRVTAGSLNALAQFCFNLGQPIQCLDLMCAPEHITSVYALRSFAWVVKNDVRPSGLAKLGLPCQLAGTGMAIPWNCITSANLASSHQAEDLKLGVDLAISGYRPTFYRDVTVTSVFPVDPSSQLGQQARWEQGSWKVMLRMIPRLLNEAIAQRRISLLAVLLDLTVPPLISYAILLTFGLFLAVAAGLLLEVWYPTLVLLGGLSALCLAILISWHLRGRALVSPRHVPQLAREILRKSSIYGRVSTWRRSDWTRADRG